MHHTNRGQTLHNRAASRLIEREGPFLAQVMTGLANFGRVACQFGNTDLEVRSAAGRLLRWRSPRLTTEELRKPWPRPIFRFSIQGFVRALPERTPRSVQRKAAGTRRGANPGEEVHSRNTRGSLYQITRFDAPDSTAERSILPLITTTLRPHHLIQTMAAVWAPPAASHGAIGLLSSPGSSECVGVKTPTAPSPEAAQKPHFYPDCK